jgi:hypothetical protein
MKGVVRHPIIRKMALVQVVLDKVDGIGVIGCLG